MTCRQLKCDAAQGSSKPLANLNQCPIPLEGAEVVPRQHAGSSMSGHKAELLALWRLVAEGLAGSVIGSREPLKLVFDAVGQDGDTP